MSKSKKSRAPGLPPHLTSAQVCFLLGLTRGRVAQLSDDGGPIVRVGRDRYAIESIPNFVRRQRERGDRSIAWQEARAQAMGERAKILRLQRRKVEGETMLISEVIAMGTSIITVVRTRILGIFPKLAPRLAMARTPADVLAIGQPEVEEALEQLSQLETVPAAMSARLDRAALSRCERGGIREELPAGSKGMSAFWGTADMRRLPAPMLRHD